MPYSLIIVGGGPAAIHILAEYGRQDQTDVPSSVIIIERSNRGPGGSAHSSSSKAFRVNMRTALHDIPGHVPFCDFLRLDGGTQDDPPTRFDLGRYVKHVAEEAERRLAAKGCPVRHVADIARNLTREDGAYRIDLEVGPSVTADVVILATGNEAPVVAEWTRSEVPQTSYDGGTDFALNISRSDEVLVKGTGPGGIDVARYLIEDLHIQNPVHLTSRGGLLSAVQTMNPISADLEAEANHVVARIVSSGSCTFLHLVGEAGAFLRRVDPGFDYERLARTPKSPLVQLQEDIEAAQKNGPRWRLALEALAVNAPALWQVLDNAGKAEMFRNDEWRRLYYTKRHAMQLSTALWLEQSLRGGLITVGLVKSTVPAHNRIVLATGPEYNVSKSQNPFLQKLLATGIAAPCMVNGEEIGGFATTNFQVGDAPRLFAMGALVRGQDFAVHSFPALARHARAIVAQLNGLKKG